MDLVTAVAFVSLLGGTLLLGGAFLGRHREDDPEATGESAADQVAKPFGVLGRALGAFGARCLYLLVRVTPLGAKFWHRLAVVSLQNYHKRAGGDAIGINHLPSDSVALEAVKFDSKLDELDGTPGWQAKGREKVWEASAQGNSLGFIGKAPVVMLDDDADHVGTWLDARVTDAVDKGNMRELYRVDEGTFSAEITDHSGVLGSGAARADGGYQVTKDFEPTSHPIFEDMLVDLGSSEGFNGSAVSFKHYSDISLDSTTQEKLKMAEQRGLLAGMDPSSLKKWMFKIFVVAALLALAGIVGPELVTSIFGGGGGGGGGGGISPFLIGSGWL